MNKDRKQILDTMLDNAFSALALAVSNNSVRNREYADAKTTYELTKAAKIINGEITGSNETQRKASEATVLELELEAMKAADRQLQLTGLTLNLAQIEAERIRWKIRLELGAVGENM